jgi:aspartyl-tRNA(Asn)/glutamyl-tRNA(Gln) amidotransferase subunit C
MITKKEVQKVAKLARLGLTEKEIKKFQKDLSSILDYIEKLKTADVSRVKPYLYPIEVENIMRKDKSGEINLETVKKIIKMAPERKGNFLKTKSILK